MKQFLYEKARVPVRLISKGNLERFQKLWPERFRGLEIGDSVPIPVKPEDILVVVAGGQGKHSAVIPSFGTTKAVTVPITDKDGNPLVVEAKNSGPDDD